MGARKQDAKVHATADTDISLCHFYQSWDQKEAGGAGEQGSREAGGEVFWLGCLIMVNHPDLI